MKKMQSRLIVILCITLLVSSCSWTRLGTLTMMSTRNIDSKMDYVELARYVDSENRDAKKALKGTQSEKGKKLDLAVDRCVATVPGGEFMKNVQIYAKGSNVKVIGDVWGKSTGFSLSHEQQKLLREKSERDSLEKEKRIKSDIKKLESEEKRQKEKEEKLIKAAGFSIGDKVTWNELGKYLKGEIIGKDDTYAAIKYIDKNSNEKIKRVRFQYLTKIVD